MALMVLKFNGKAISVSARSTYKISDTASPPQLEGLFAMKSLAGFQFIEVKVLLLEL